MAFEFTDNNFSEVVENDDKVVMVDFWAAWCGPCKQIAPIIEELASDYEGKAIVGKLDVDTNPEVAMKYGIRSIPTLLFFKNGELIDRHVGTALKSALANKIDTLL